jgi:hypothetical protein
MERIAQFFGKALEIEGQKLVPVGREMFELRDSKGITVKKFTSSRALARDTEGVDLLGLDHPLVESAIERWRNAAPDELGVSVHDHSEQAVVTWWYVVGHGQRGEQISQIIPLAVRPPDGSRLPALERTANSLLHRSEAPPTLAPTQRIDILKNHLEPMLQREAQQRGFVERGGFSVQLLTWVETSMV